VGGFVRINFCWCSSSFRLSKFYDGTMLQSYYIVQSLRSGRGGKITYETGASKLRFELVAVELVRLVEYQCRVQVLKYRGVTK
jgi:hypothetical protein